MTQNILVFLSNNQLIGTLPTQIGLMSSVREVWLNHNSLVGKIPTEIGYWRRIQRLKIESNQLMDTLPDGFENLTQLRELTAFENSFTGEIPSSIWSADSLEFLRLHNNDLYASVPDDYCANMVVLDLDDSNWFFDSPKVNCSCCRKTCSFWDAVQNPAGANTKCQDNNILYLLDDYGIITTFIKDVH